MRFLLLLLCVACSSTTPTDVDAADDAAELPLLPEIDAACKNLGLAEAGPCCEQAFCFTPDDGTCDAMSAGGLVSYAGKCTCGEWTGPYRSPDTTKGTCCYLAWAASCQ